MGKKRGVIEVQFNWIFILIIGGLIILFFLGVIRTQKKVAETKISVTISTDLRAILSGVEVSTQTASLIDLPKTEIEYTCEGYTVGGITGMRPIASFSPNVIKGNKLMSWALPWSVPYRVMNFIYLTTPDIRYIVVNDLGELAEELFDILPEQYVVEEGQERLLMNKELMSDVEDGDPGDKNNYKVRYVFFNEQSAPSLPDGLEKIGEDLTAINIKPGDGGLDGNGTIEFYEQSGTEFSLISSTYYLGKSSLIAAIFAEDIESYECNMQRAFKKLEFITDIYLNRTRELRIYSEPTNPSCASMYLAAESNLIKIKEKATSLSEGLDITEIGNIYVEISSLINENDKAQKLSCPEIY